MSCGNLTLNRDRRSSRLFPRLDRDPMRGRVNVRMTRLMCFFSPSSGGARALTPTPPSVTSVSRVCLFPRYVRRIFPPLHTACFLRATRNKQAQKKGGFYREQSCSGVYQPWMDRGGFYLQVNHQWSPNLPSVCGSAEPVSV